MKIKDLVVGGQAEIDLVVKASEIKLTRQKKPYLLLELFDGFDSITANMWDYHQETKPEKNDILTVAASVGEWSGNKQLTIKSFGYNTVMDINEFAPKSDMDINEYVAKVKELIDALGNETLRSLVYSVFKDNIHLWKTVPGAKSVHHAYLAGTLKHSVDTAIKAKVIAEVTDMCSVDLCVAGALVHDLGKLWTYATEGVVIDFTDDGNLLDHIIIGCTKLEEYRTPTSSDLVDLLQHIVASHHGTYEWGSPVTPRFLEAWVVHYADGIDAKCGTVTEINAKATGKHTEKAWTLGGRQMFTQAHIQLIVGG